MNPGRLASVYLSFAAAIALSGAVATYAFGAFDGTSVSSLQVTTLVVGDPGPASASSADGCATVTVSWTAAGNADSYRVEVSVDGGPWADLYTATGNVTEVQDSAGRTGSTVTYRVRARDAASGWEGAGAASTAPLTC